MSQSSPHTDSSPAAGNTKRVYKLYSYNATVTQHTDSSSSSSSISSSAENKETHHRGSNYDILPIWKDASTPAAATADSTSKEPCRTPYDCIDFSARRIIDAHATPAKCLDVYSVYQSSHAQQQQAALLATCTNVNANAGADAPETSHALSHVYSSAEEIQQVSQEAALALNLEFAGTARSLGTAMLQPKSFEQEEFRKDQLQRGDWNEVCVFLFLFLVFFCPAFTVTC